MHEDVPFFSEFILKVAGMSSSQGKIQLWKLSCAINCGIFETVVWMSMKCSNQVNSFLRRANLNTVIVMSLTTDASTPKMLCITILAISCARLTIFADTHS